MSTVETAIGRFGWHDHRSPDPKAAQRFYTELLGWELEIFPMGEFEYPMIKANDQTHGGFGPVDGDEPAHWLGSIVVEDVDAAAARVASAGGTILVEPSDIQGVGRWAVASRPAGRGLRAVPVDGRAADVGGGLRLGRARDERHRGGEALLRRGRRLGVVRTGHGRRLHLHDLPLERRRPRRRLPEAAGHAGCPGLAPVRRHRRRRREPRAGDGPGRDDDHRGRWTSRRSAAWRSSRIPRAQSSGSTSRKRPRRNQRAGAPSSRPRRPRRYSPIRHKWAASSHIWIPARAR